MGGFNKSKTRDIFNGFKMIESIRLMGGVIRVPST